MKKIAMFALAASVLCGCAPKESDTVKMITEATFPPYEFLRGKEIAGIDVEICREIVLYVHKPNTSLLICNCNRLQRLLFIMHKTPITRKE